MSIATELSRIQTDRNTIRAKLVELGMANNTDNLTRLAAAIEGLVNRGAVSITVTEGGTYTIPAGYHNGSGTVTAVSDTEGDAAKYKLQSKNVTPTKKQQSVTPDTGYYGLSDVTVASIPDAYQDVSSTTAAAADVLTGKVYVLANGTVTTGTMPNNGAVSKTLDVTTVSYTIPKGYHSGTGTVKLTLETKTVTPTKAEQTITPTSGKVLSKVTVAAIPAAYQDVTAVTATAPNVLTGKKFVNSAGTVVTGSMPNNGSKSLVVSAHDEEVAIPAGYHDGNGVVSIPGAEQEKFLPENIKTGVSLLGVTGTFTADGTAVAGNILSGKIAYSKGSKITGSMPNYATSSGWVDYIESFDTPIFIPAGYHGEYGGELASRVELDPEEAVKIEDTSNIKYGVTILGSQGSFTGDGTVVAADMLSGEIAYSKGAKVVGSMPNNGSTSKTIDGLTTLSATIPAGYTTGGTVSLTGDIEEALAAI